VAYNLACDEYAQRVVDALQKNWEDKEIYIFNYSDESEYFSVLEHGGIFNNLPHKQISNH